jgi:prepilin-type N-terminal cleavage/methylation domain-containing protein/prepilin-type processing-associated H-X9-DG protein
MIRVLAATMCGGSLPEFPTMFSEGNRVRVSVLPGSQWPMNGGLRGKVEAAATPTANLTWRRKILRVARSRSFERSAALSFRHTFTPCFARGAGNLRRRGFTLIELLVTMSIIAILSSLLFPISARAKRNANSVHCRGNLRQIGISVRLYADDHEGRLPVILTTGSSNGAPSPRLMEVLPGLPPQTFQCRDDRSGRFRTAGSSYDWNSALNGRLLHRIGEDDGEPAAQEALVIDHEAWHGYRNGAFADGHVGPLQ